MRVASAVGLELIRQAEPLVLFGEVGTICPRIGHMLLADDSSACW